MIFRDDVGDPSSLSRHLTDCLYRDSFRRQAVKIAVKLRSRPIRWFLGHPSVGGRRIPDLSHAFSNRSYFRSCDRFWLSSVQRARRLGAEKKKKELENVAIIAMYCHLRPPDAIAFPT